jgi:hypothetical protein
MPNTENTFPVGQRRIFPRGYSLEHISVYVPEGAQGEVVYSDRDIVSIRLDEPIPNLHDSEWENCVDFSVSDWPGCVERFTTTVHH